MREIDVDNLRRYIAKTFVNALRDSPDFALDDLVQEACVRILAKQRKYRPQASASWDDWCIIVARNVVYSLLRKQNRARAGMSLYRRKQRADQQYRQRIVGAELSLCDITPDTIDEILAQHGFSDTARHVCKLRFVDGMPAYKIERQKSTKNMPRAQIKRVVSHAKRILQKEIER